MAEPLVDMAKAVLRDRDEEKTEDEKIVDEAHTRFGRCESWESRFRQLYVEDQKFGHADSDNLDQWPDVLLNDRELTQKVTLTINKTRVHCLQIINDAKQNKPGIVVHPTTTEATYEAAEVYEDVVRHIEYRSKATQVYDKAMENTVFGGYAVARVVTSYVHQNVDPKRIPPHQIGDQELLIKSVNDPLTVYFDPDAKEPDKSDGEFTFVFDDMTKDKFNRLYPKFKDRIGSQYIGAYNSWINKDNIRVAEYWRKEHQRITLVSAIDPDSGQRISFDKEEVPPSFRRALKKNPDAEYQERDADFVTIKCYKIAGNLIVDRYDWLGQHIPLVPMIGEEIVIDGQMDRKGHVRYLKDPQRMYNYNSPLALDTPLPSPHGWTKMGAVSVGDWLFDEHGKPVRVAGLSPIFINRACYRVEFDDGSTIVADADHLWTVEARGKRKSKTWDWKTKTISTAELAPKTHYIYSTKPLNLPDADLPVDPYVLGLWLGNGHSRDGVITSWVNDGEEIASRVAACGYRVGPRRITSVKSASTFTVYGLITQLKKLGVAMNKHIPAAYLRASESQRRALLQGLMDTDGNFNQTLNVCSFSNVNPAIVEGFGELLRSLGIKKRITVVPAASRMMPGGAVSECQESTVFHFSAPHDESIFRLSRKAIPQNAERRTHRRRTKRIGIVSVTQVPSVPVRCVNINSESHLFLAGEAMVPTHNSREVEVTALQTNIPWTMPAETAEEYEEYYKSANIQNLAYLPYKAFDDEGRPLPPPQRVDPPRASEGALRGMQIAEQEMMMATGQYQAQMGENENAKSGKAIAERQRQGDNATYGFIDAQAIMVCQLGRILVDLIPKIYDTRRIMRIRGEDGMMKNILIDPNAQQAVLKKEDIAKREASIIFNPNVGMYSVEADTGPNYATKRQEAWNAIVQILSQNKALIPIIGDLLFTNGDFPGAGEIAQRLRRLVPPQALTDEPQPQDQALQQQVQQLGGLVQKLNDSLRDKSAEINIKAFDALTKRLVAVGNAGPIVSEEQAQPLIINTEQAMLTGSPSPAEFGAQGVPTPPQGPLPPQSMPPQGPLPPQPGPMLQPTA